jgi:antitoxin (DNA-binding transcriptional repressor) of toxin-antitoxin stability system
MAVPFPRIEELPQRKATEVKNKWGDLVREVRAHGSVAVTHHDKVEMVVVGVGQYREMAALVAGARQRHQAALADLSAEFDRRLAQLQAADARDRAEAAMASEGRAARRPRAGMSF